MSLKEKYNLPKKGFSRELYRGFNLHEVVITVNSEGTIRLTVYDENGRVALNNEILQKPWLQDAQKEIDRLEKQIEKEIMIRCRYSEQIVELKQKLQQLLNEFPKSEFVTMGNLKAISSTFKGEEVQNWKKKFEELLKEEEANPNV